MAHGKYDIGKGVSRGIKSAEQTSVAVEPDYRNLEVSLRLELMESQACWYELLLNASPQWDAKLGIIDKLRAMQARVGATPVAQQHGQSDHCLVAFWAARTKVRFCMHKKPRFTMLGNDFIFYVEVGKDRVRKKLSTTFVDAQTGEPVRPHIELSENYITINLPEEGAEKASVHDFLRKCGLELGINTDLHAVSYAHSPLSDWLGGADRHLTQMLYQVSNEEYDFFLFCNLFKVTLMQMESSARMSAITGSPVWEMPGAEPSAGQAWEQNSGMYVMSHHERGLLIERAFDAYFQLAPQLFPDMQHVRSLAAHTPSYSVQILMDLENPHELYRFGSWEMEAADQHIFSCEIKDTHTALSVLN